MAMMIKNIRWAAVPAMVLVVGVLTFETLANSHKPATFAGGHFWCMEAPFEKMEGVKEVLSGYTGGTEKNPNYEQVSSGATSHLEAVQVRFDPEEISYQELLDVFWRQIDPTDGGGQFAKRGRQYRTAIFFHNDTQKRMAHKSLEQLTLAGVFDGPTVTEIRAARKFYRAESYHQDFYKKNPSKYKSYRAKSGRDEYLKRIWSRVELQFKSK